MFLKKNTTPISRGMYAWNAIHAGSFLLFVESLVNCHKFVFLPGPSDYFLTYEDFDNAVKKGILEFVDTLPKEIYEEALSLSCPPPGSNVLQYEKDKKHYEGND